MRRSSRIALLLLAAAACAHVARPPEPPLNAPPQNAQENVYLEQGVEHGVASVYANRLAGKLTASGEPYDPERLTAAHKTLPLGTKVQVVSETNGRSVVVRVNDRGPFVEGRIIDLSPAAAARIGLTGLMRVEVRQELPKPPSSGPADAAAAHPVAAPAHGQ